MPYIDGHNARVVGPATGCGLAVIAALAWQPVVTTQVGRGWGLQAGLVFLLVMAVPLLGREAGAVDRFGVASVVTAVRALIAAVTGGCVGRAVAPTTLWVLEGLVVAFAVLDGVDGWLARRRGESSRFGASFDMETDAAFILVLCLLVWEQHGAGAWVLLSGLMRYAFVAAGWLVPWLAAPLRPTKRAQTVAVLQFVGLAVAFVPSLPAWVSQTSAAVSVVSLAWSFALDVARLASARHAPLSAWR